MAKKKETKKIEEAPVVTEEQPVEVKKPNRLGDLISRIEDRFGKDAVAGKRQDIEFVHSGSYLLDEILGGGWAKGRVVEAYGGFSSGKTSIAFHLATEVQKAGKAVGYLDTENAVDPKYMQAIGIDLSSDKFILSQPSTAEEVLEIAKEMCNEESIGLVVIDSIAGLVPTALLNGEAGDAHIGLTARLLSSQVNILKNICKQTGCILFCINQIRSNIGGYGAATTTPGGFAIPFYASQRIELARVGSEKEGETQVSNKVKITCKKNKVALPFKACQIIIRFGVGIDKVMEIVNMGIDLGVLSKKGTYIYYGEEKIGFGFPKARKRLLEDVKLFEKIKKDVLSAFRKKETTFENKEEENEAD